jgi:hypothetical protein
MKLKIISDGTHRGTKVINAETGEVLQGVYEVSWEHKANDIPHAVIKCYQVPYEVEMREIKRYELTNK